MSKLIIAVDIDDVLAAEAEFIIDYSNNHWGHTLSPDEYHEHWGEMWNADIEEVERRAKELHAPGIVTQYRLLEQGYEALRFLSAKYRLVIVTSRRLSVKQETLSWLNDNFGSIFEEVKFTGFYDTLQHERHKMTKGDMLKEMNVAFLIDDQPKHCFSAAAHGINCLLFGEYGVSRGLDLPQGVTRCKDWAAVLEYFEKETG